VADVASRRHLQDVRETISAVLDPRAMREVPGAIVITGRAAGPGPNAAGRWMLQSSERYDYDNDPFLAAPDACWVDLTIR
jgi:hypothetical protein